jgi:uncharacterized membrane protein HdeD (DUF308 family)
MKDWVKWLLLGILSVLFGFYVLGNAVVASIAVTAVIGVLLLISGGFQVFAGFTAEGTGAKILGALMGLLMLYLGISFISNPLEGTVSLTMLALIMFAAGGLLRLFFAFQVRGSGYFWWLVISGVISLVLAFYLMGNLAGASMVLLGTLMGVEMLMNGIGLIAFGLTLRSNE